MNRFLEVFFYIWLVALLVLSFKSGGYIGKVSVFNVGAYIIAPVLALLAVRDIRQKKLAGWAYLAVGMGIFLMMINEFII